MITRPLSITIIAWFLIVSGILGIFGSLFALSMANPSANEIMAQSPIPVPMQYAMSIAGTAVTFVSGFFILRGKNWARYLYVVWSAIGFVIALLTSRMKIMLIPSAVIFFVIAVLLFRPTANAFFASGGENIDPQSIPSTRRILGVTFYVFAGFFLACSGFGAIMSFDGGDGIVKTMTLFFHFLPFVICLAIGKWLSRGSQWKREVGTLFVVSATAGALMATMIAVMFASPEFQKSLPSRDIDFTLDYTFAAIWFSAWALLGGALLLLSRKAPKVAKDDPKIPKLVDR